MVVHDLAKVEARVRFSYPAPNFTCGEFHDSEGFSCYTSRVMKEPHEDNFSIFTLGLILVVMFLLAFISSEGLDFNRKAQVKPAPTETR